MSITKLADIEPLMVIARKSPSAALPQLLKLAGNEEWQTREVAATAMVELGKRHSDAVLREASRWARNANPNVRRAASEGLRGIVQREPEKVRPVLEALRADPDRYVQKSVANVLRNASKKQLGFVLELKSIAP
ncbi:MAG: HEAT repeat domain-containing protein [Gemmatimonadaceae bacterium]